MLESEFSWSNMTGHGYPVRWKVCNAEILLADFGSRGSDSLLLPHVDDRMLIIQRRHLP